MQKFHFEKKNRVDSKLGTSSGNGAMVGMGILTPDEAQETDIFLLEYPELNDLISQSATGCTEQELLQIAKGLIQVDTNTREAVYQAYRRFETGRAAGTLSLPPKLVHSYFQL